MNSALPHSPATMPRHSSAQWYEAEHGPDSLPVGVGGSDGWQASLVRSAAVMFLIGHFGRHGRHSRSWAGFPRRPSTGPTTKWLGIASESLAIRFTADCPQTANRSRLKSWPSATGLIGTKYRGYWELGCLR